MRGQPRAPANRPHRVRCSPHQLSPQPLSVVVSVMRADVVSHSHLVDEDGLYVAHVTLFNVLVSPLPAPGTPRPRPPAGGERGGGGAGRPPHPPPPLALFFPRAGGGPPPPPRG